MWTDDPVKDQMSHDMELEERPCLYCGICGSSLYEGDAYYEIDNMNICPDCLKEEYRRVV